MIKDKIYIDGEEYRYVEIRHRGKYVAKDGKAVNPIKRNQKATMHINEDGYPCFGGGIPVHQYVAKAWVDGWFEGCEINHKDFNRMNFDASNLEYITHKENVEYSVIYNGDIWSKSKQGEKNGRATFTEEKVKEIKEKYRDGETIAQILRDDYCEFKNKSQYKSLHSKYAKICHGETWKYV